MTPPQKIVRLKLCEIVVSCLKRIFVPKRLIRVNPGGKVCDPPPVISRVKIIRLS